MHRPMIPLNSRQGLPPNAFWYVALRSLAAAAILALIAWAVHAAGNSPGAACRGALCGVLSRNQLAGLMYLFAAFLVVRATLGFRWFSYVLTDRTISINSGILFQSSCTIRFDRIQDIDTWRDPLHLLLGLKSVAIWTASPDQRVGNSKRPDGLIVLDADTADWLKDYLSNPPAATADATARSSRPLAGPSSAARRASTGPVLLLLAAAAIALAALGGLWKKGAGSAPSIVTAPSVSTAPPTVSTPGAGVHLVHRRASHLHPVPSAEEVGVASAGYAVACSLHGSADANGVRPCAELGQARRCEHENDFPSHPTPEPAELTVVNQSNENVKFYWLNPSGTRALYASLPPGGRVRQPSHIGAHWLVSAEDGRCIGIFDAATITVGVF